MIIGVCNAKLMESLDSPLKAMVLSIYAETIAITQAATSIPVPHMRTRRLSSQMENFFLLEAKEDNSI